MNPTLIRPEAKRQCQRRLAGFPSAQLIPDQAEIVIAAPGVAMPRSMKLR